LAAVDFLFPKTFNEVDVLDDDTAGVIAGEKATVDAARNTQRTARKKDFTMVNQVSKVAIWIGGLYTMVFSRVTSMWSLFNTTR
jgi:hypothetical protein